MTDISTPTSPHDFWQAIKPSGTFDRNPATGFSTLYPAAFANGEQIALPIRTISEGQSAIASLIVNQASFPVFDRFVHELSELVLPATPEIVVGLPTLGLSLAADIARKLGHARFVALSTSRKFWYDDDLSVPLSSITSPTHKKQLFIDPRMLPLLTGKRILLVDDVISSGTSMAAGIALLRKCQLTPSVIGAAMLQTDRWVSVLEAADISRQIVKGVISTPLLAPQGGGGGWRPVQRVGAP